MSILGFSIKKISHSNMEPIISAGSYVVVSHWLYLFRIKINNLVIIKDSLYGSMFNKISVIDKYGILWGVNEKSPLASSEIKPIRKNQIIGKVCWVLPRIYFNK